MMPNQSPEPTAVGAVSSAIAVQVASRRWLSFLRYSSALTERRYRRFAEVSYQFGERQTQFGERQTGFVFPQFNMQPKKRRLAAGRCGHELL